MLFSFSYSQSKGNDEETLSKIKALEIKLSGIQSKSTVIPTEEVNKASEWIEEAKKSFNSGRPGVTQIIMEKASYQVEYLNALIEESRVKREVEEKKEFLQKIRSQTEELKAINKEVENEIKGFEDK
ncbi:MAG TPA: hypothetical protein VI935_07090 [Thermodesulfobacteriota bacterium]|nr:hypothetical protein [Thermodesulfobacteriota bacterium]